MGRRQNAGELIGLLDEVFATRTLDEWAEVFDTEPDMFWAPVNTIDDVLVDPQMHAAGAFVEVPEREGGAAQGGQPLRLLRHTLVAEGTRAPPR